MPIVNWLNWQQLNSCNRSINSCQNFHSMIFMKLLKSIRHHCTHIPNWGQDSLITFITIPYCIAAIHNDCHSQFTNSVATMNDAYLYFLCVHWIISVFFMEYRQVKFLTYKRIGFFDLKQIAQIQNMLHEMSLWSLAFWWLAFISWDYRTLYMHEYFDSGTGTMHAKTIKLEQVIDLLVM